MQLVLLWNDVVMILALALASNFDATQHILWAKQQLAQWGHCEWASTHRIPCRDGIGADYDNTACLLWLNEQQQQDLFHYFQQCMPELALQTQDWIVLFKQYLHILEQQTGRKRPSHQISLDLDLIAWGDSLSNMQFNQKKLPLPFDVVIPLQEIWDFEQQKVQTG